MFPPSVILAAWKAALQRTASCLSVRPYFVFLLQKGVEGGWLEKHTA